MEDGTPALGVGFEIDTDGAFGNLIQLDGRIDESVANAVAEFDRVKRATAGMVDVSAATANIRAFGSAATREAQNIAREKANTTKAGEALIRQLEREAAALGRTKDQMRDAKVEAIALAAAEQQNADLADRLLAAARQRQAAAEAAAEAQQRAAAAAAAAMQAEANAADRLAREHAALVAQVRGSQAAQEADAAAAERLRMSTDPLYAALKRINAEIAESTRLYHNGATAPAEYARQQEVLAQRLKAAAEQHDAVAVAGRRNAQSMRMVALQLPDIIQGLLTGQKPMQVFLQQGGQIAQIGMMAEGGLKGMAGQIGRAALAFWPLALAAGAGALAIKGLQSAANDGTDMKKYAASLGVTQKEMRHLTDLHVTFGDTAKAVFQVAGRAIWDGIGPSVTSAWTTMKGWLGWLGAAVKDALNFMIGGFVGAYRMISKTWEQFPAVMGDVFMGAVNASIEAINWLIRKAVEGVNNFIGGANTILDKVGLHLPELDAPQIAKVNNQFAGAAKKFTKTLQDEMKKAQSVDYLGKGASAVIDQARKNARDRIKADAEKKGYLDPDKAKTDKHAEQLARENEAIEAQIRNLYKLADAYKVSGAAALIAEARVKAESDAIKKRGDIELFIDRQIRLTIAQRVSDAAKSTAALRDQAEAQERVNAAVAAGLIPAARAADMVKDQIADLPLLAAIEAAQIRAAAAAKAGDVARQNEMAAAVKKATAALADQRAERERARAAEATARYDLDMASGKDQLALLQEEARLIGATNEERARGLAIVRAMQYATANNFSPDQAAAYAKQQGDIAVETERTAAATRAWSDALNFAADRWDAIANNISEAASGMADAFGDVGRAIGDIGSIYAGFHARRERLDAEHKARVAAGFADEKDKTREQQLYALRSATLQVDAYGDMVSAAKGFFDEKSKGYKALQAAEQAFRAVQLAMSIASMFQDTAETVSHVANAGARATANAAEGVSAQAKLPFPANIAAMAATAAAVVAFGIAMLGGGGRGRSTSAPRSSEDIQKATGIGTVLGSPNDKSASIARSIDLVAKNTDGVLDYNSQMLNSLRSIDASIGAMAATVAKQINVSGSLYDTSKLGIGSSGSAGFLGLFSSSTTRSLYDAGITLAAATVGDIVANGIAGSTYQIVQQVKKSSGFLGIGGGTRTTYQTTTGGLPSDITASIQSVIAALENGIVTAAGAIGIDGAKAMLDNFTVSIGQLSFNGLDAQGIEDQLNAVFSSVGDQMVSAILPGIAKFQKVGEGLFETLERVASTVVVVDGVMQKLGRTSTTLGIDVDMAIAGLFDSVGDFKSAADAYFETYYSTAEQTAAKAAQIGKVFGSLGLAMPSTLAAFRALVDAQDLTTAAGQATYATLLQLAPAFADLQAAMSGAKSAADILSERQDLERQLLELQGNTDAIRQLDLAKLDASNRALQLQIWAIQDAQEAAKAADELRQAWQSVGDSIMDEVKRIRGLSDTTGAGTFASLLGQFNAATAAARAGDQDAAKSLPQLSQALLTAAANAATSQQELARVQAQTAASLETTYGMISQFGTSAATLTDAALLAASSPTAQASGASANDNANADLLAEIAALREEVAGMRSENNSGHAATAGNTAATNRKLDAVTADSGGTAISTLEVAAA